MAIIRTHDITLYDKDNIILKPLSDEHLPLLYQWNSFMFITSMFCLWQVMCKRGFVVWYL